MLVNKAYAQVAIGDHYNIAFDSFGHFFHTLLSPIYAIAGIIFMFLLIFGGFSVIMGSGSQDTNKIQQGQKAIVAAVVGFIIIVGSYFIIQLIEVLTGVQILNPNI